MRLINWNYGTVDDDLMYISLDESFYFLSEYKKWKENWRRFVKWYGIDNIYDNKLPCIIGKSYVRKSIGTRMWNYGLILDTNDIF